MWMKRPAKLPDCSDLEENKNGAASVWKATPFFDGEEWESTGSLFSEAGFAWNDGIPGVKRQRFPGKRG